MAKAKSTPTTTLTRRTALALAAGASAAAVATTTAAATIAASEADPMLAVIEHHKVRHAEFADAARREDTARVEKLERAALEELVETTADNLHEADWALATTVPTTLAGALAALEYQRSRSSALEELFG
jgi:hypothetical protein